MRYAKLLLVGISVLLFTGCVAEKRLTLCQTDNETLTRKVADKKAEMSKLEEIMNNVVTSTLNETKKVKEQLKQAKAESAKIRKELSAAREARKKDRAKMEKALKSIMSKIAEAGKKIKAYESKIVALKKELAEADKKLKDAEAKAAKLAEENRNLKSGAKLQVKPEI
ncbi:MAG: hypothetical protein KAJ52_01660 [Sedimentisphaerales bacterium]|nr:hypothetical protein [Sedimentisphaerales bacterium]